MSQPPMGDAVEPRSSVEIKTSTRGIDITVKVYAGSPLDGIGDVALGEYLRLRAEHERRLMGELAA